MKTAFFYLISYFPDPKDDFLFYLGLAGSVTRAGLFIQDTMGNMFRVPVATVVETVFGFRRRTLPSVNAKMPEWGLHEMIVCAAFMAASNSGHLGGSSLEELLTRFVAGAVGQVSRPHNCRQDRLDGVF